MDNNEESKFNKNSDLAALAQMTEDLVINF